MKSSLSVNESDKPFLKDRVVYWLKRRKHLFNASELTKETGLTRFKINNLIDGKGTIDEKQATIILKWIAGLSDTEIKAEVVSSNPHGLIIDGDI